MTTYSMRTAAGARRRVSNVEEWTVGNFKSLEHVGLALAPLTLLTGANSSGKSSLIQSLLLLAQSTDDEIILNGTLVRLGDPKDVIRSGMGEMKLAYTASQQLKGDEPGREWSFELTLAAEGSTLVVTEFYAAHGDEPVIEATAKRVTAQARTEVNPENGFGDSILRVRELNGRRAPARTYLTFRGFHPETMLFRRRPERLLASLRKNYSSTALRENPEQAIHLYEELMPWLRSDEAIASLSEDLSQQVEKALRGDGGRARFVLNLEPPTLEALFEALVASEGQADWMPLPVSRYNSAYFARPYAYRNVGAIGLPGDYSEVFRSLSVADDALRTIRESIRYLGPLREEPQVVSATGGRNRSVPAGPKGEYTADLLARAKNELVTFFDWDRKRHREKLPDAVSLWTTYLGVGETVAVEDQGKLGRGLRIKVNGVERDLTTVGVGASQLLPVLTVVLAAEPGSLILLEQPELHLHPAVQSRLADFFLSARPDIKIVVETHSEYLVSRLRRRVAEGLIDPNQASIMFAEQQAGITRMRRLEINSMGDLSDWPAGFFDTQDEEARALVKAVSQSVKAKRRGKR